MSPRSGAQRQVNTRGVPDEGGPSRSRGSASKRKQRDATDEMTFSVMQEIDKLIRPPDYTAVQHLILEHTGKYRPWFDDCIGAINGTHVPCVPRRENADGKFYLADSGYVNKDCFLSLFRRETYHLPEYQRHRAELGNRRETRFKILKGINSYPMEKQVMIPVACAVVHNFIRIVQIGDPFLEEYVADCVPIRENVDVNADYVLDDGVDDTGPSPGTQHHGSSTDAMNQMRERIADAMWERYQSYPWYRAT
ncbi:hypothetical protein TIFTF001_027830 [Ficus carica]|uniref:DDE Tnp4 domain-containing protein n=1 Tax=Ficus carica TaxID=3494 RepID=A0AA88IZ72_FICCA|nr:hypothetical protein TIFTF001_027830 [Ficus carica]